MPFSPLAPGFQVVTQVLHSQSWHILAALKCWSLHPFVSPTLFQESPFPSISLFCLSLQPHVTIHLSLPFIALPPVACDRCLVVDLGHAAANIQIPCRVQHCAVCLRAVRRSLKGNRVEIYVKAHRKTLFFLLAGMENDPAVSQVYLFHCAFVISLFERGGIKGGTSPILWTKRSEQKLPAKEHLDWKDVKKKRGSSAHRPTGPSTLPQVMKCRGTARFGRIKWSR